MKVGGNVLARELLKDSVTYEDRKQKYISRSLQIYKEKLNKLIELDIQKYLFSLRDSQMN
jgi:hypothetical protein